MKPIGERADLADGRGLRFDFRPAGERAKGVAATAAVAAFAVEYKGRVYAYRNHCPHLGIELDWAPGVFFDPDRRTLVCSTHGARFDPRTGRCISGPCAGQSLTAVRVVERDGRLYIDSTSG